MNILKKSVKNIANILFPNICICCQNGLLNSEKNFCIACLNEFPTITTDEVIVNKFKGIIPINFATSKFEYNSSFKISLALKALKYQSKPEVGIELGKLLGEKLINYPIHNIEYILPIPLTQKRQNKRGYNQSEYICQGISQKTNIPINNTLLFRNQFAKSQTKLTREKRFENIEDAFVFNSQLTQKSHFLIIDDIITTGATMISAGKVILEKDNQVSFASLCITSLL